MAGDESLPAINIFAPPPPEAPSIDRAEPEPAAFAPPPEPPAPLRREPPEAAEDAEIVPDPPVGEASEPRRARLPDEDIVEDAEGDADEGPDDGAGDRLDRDEAHETGNSGAEPAESAENRLAALITRYQRGMHGHAAGEAEPVVAGGSLSAIVLAERAGATEVEDLLAVSAAWLALCEGRARFTRREVMEVFETLPGEHPRTLEARIKGFGSLVRSGSVQLVEDGAFSLAPAERARFRALIDQG
jgi:hypothetical protein